MKYYCTIVRPHHFGPIFKKKFGVFEMTKIMVRKIKMYLTYSFDLHFAMENKNKDI